MKRYIVDRAALAFLNISALNAQEELAKEKVITNEPLKFFHIPYASMMLSDEQVSLLKERNIFCEPESFVSKATLGGDYEKIRTSYYKAGKKALTGAGVKVGILDSGCNTTVVPAEFTVNYADANAFADVYGHGTETSSIIKHPTMGLAPNCIFYHAKVVTDAGSIPETAVLSGFDYVISNNLDIVNCSWTADTTAIRTAVANVISNGTIVSAASGNTVVDDDYTLLPAGLEGVIAVNNMKEDGTFYGRNVIAPPSVTNSHGITIACSGENCEVYTKGGVYTTSGGTSFASPFFVGTFAIYKEQFPHLTNQEVVNYILLRATNSSYPKYFGAGIISF